MKKIINNLVILSACISSCLIICTFLNSYHFIYLGLMFNSYLPIQIGVAITMVLAGLKYLLIENSYRRFIYFIFCIIIASGLLISIPLVR